jgi:hypothetical protein
MSAPRSDRPRGRRPTTGLAVALLVVVAACLSGCRRGPVVVPVSGVVEVDGKPLASGAITVVPKDGRPASGRIGKDGRFTLTSFAPGDGVLTGTHQVVVTAHESLGGSRLRWLVPAACRSMARSPLKIEVTGPTQDARISISTGGKPLEIEDVSVVGDIAPDGSLSK